MTEPAISVRGLSKRYRLGAITRHTLGDEITYLYHKLRGRNAAAHMGTLKTHTAHTKSNDRSPAAQDFWALRDISFEVQPGDVVGIIGRNGSGKSTLLKILTRITEPTSGEAFINGRVASLLEVGTGFHPELTGRENVYMNGTVLGMKKREINAKFDEIVAFSEIEKFIDTPVKRYSSGMYVRLAFAVAAHLDPEILLVDEVLAVGDAAFQKKCLAKMGDVAKAGRTVLFVSHNMAAVQHLCNRGIALHNGCIHTIGTQLDAVSAYLALAGGSHGNLAQRVDRTGNGDVRVEKIEFVDNNGGIVNSVACGQDFSIRLYFTRTGIALSPRIIASLLVKTQMDVPVFLNHNRLNQQTLGTLPEKGYIEFKITRLPLAPANYRLSYSLMLDGVYLDAIDDAIELTVISGNFFLSSEVPPATHGICLVDGSWSVSPF